jgi:Transglycosylase SLT domain
MTRGSSVLVRAALAAALAFVLLVFALPSRADQRQAVDPGWTASTELIDPDCDPKLAESADPALVAPSDGACPPGDPDCDPKLAESADPALVVPSDGACPPDELDPAPPPTGGSSPPHHASKPKPKRKAGGKSRGGKRKRGERKGARRAEPKRTGGTKPPRTKREAPPTKRDAGEQPAAAAPARTFALGGCGAEAVPTGLAPIYESASRAYQLGPAGPEILAAINEIESAFGANMGPSSAGAIGWMQFMPATWAVYGMDADGDGIRNPWDPEDAIFAAARYLRASGMPEDPHGALWAYNRADWYVADVLYRAECLGAAAPLPAASLLDPKFAAALKRESDRSRMPWEPMLAMLRARGKDGPVPAGRAKLHALARRLAARGARKHPRRALRALARGRSAGPEDKPWSRRAVPEEHAVALAHYNRAVGLRGLVKGLKAVKQRLARRALRAPRLAIYGGGRSDIKTGVTDVRVLVLLLYLSSRYGEVTVTSLTTGHSYLTASGNVSAHSYGGAVDISAVKGTSILGNQEPGGLTERALRRILQLPRELRPRELISLLELGGPSFALPDHGDHIHVGY